MESVDRGGETGVYTEGLGQGVTGRTVEGLRVRGTEGLQENREGGSEDSGVVRAVCGLVFGVVTDSIIKVYIFVFGVD